MPTAVTSDKALLARRAIPLGTAAVAEAAVVDVRCVVLSSDSNGSAAIAQQKRFTFLTRKHNLLHIIKHY